MKLRAIGAVSACFLALCSVPQARADDLVVLLSPGYRTVVVADLNTLERSGQQLRWQYGDAIRPRQQGLCGAPAALQRHAGKRPAREGRRERHRREAGTRIRALTRCASGEIAVIVQIMPGLDH